MLNVKGITADTQNVGLIQVSIGPKKLSTELTSMTDPPPPCG